MRLRRAALTSSMALVLFLVGCGGSSGPMLIPTPVVTSLSPDSAVAGGASFTLTLSGNGFQTYLAGFLERKLRYCRSAFHHLRHRRI